MALACWVSALVETFTSGEPGWGPGGRERISWGNISGLRSYKDNVIGRLLVHWRQTVKGGG